MKATCWCDTGTRQGSWSWPLGVAVEDFDRTRMVRFASFSLLIQPWKCFNSWLVRGASLLVRPFVLWGLSVWKEAVRSLVMLDGGALCFWPPLGQFVVEILTLILLEKHRNNNPSNHADGRSCQLALAISVNQLQFAVTASRSFGQVSTVSRQTAHK